MTAVKVCTRCGHLLELAAFHRNRAARDGRTAACGECRNAARCKPGGHGRRVRVAPDAADRLCLGPCGRVLPVTAFGPHPRGAAQRAARCRACAAAARRALRAAA